MTDQPSTRTRNAVVIDAAAPMISNLIHLILNHSVKQYGEDFEVASTDDGQEGLDLIASVRPDLVFLDFRVNGIDGFEVYQRMKADEYMKNIPIIVMTVKQDAYNSYIRSNLMTVEAYFTKPFLPKELANSVIKILKLDDQETT